MKKDEIKSMDKRRAIQTLSEYIDYLKKKKYNITKAVADFLPHSCLHTESYT